MAYEPAAADRLSVLQFHSEIKRIRTRILFFIHTAGIQTKRIYDIMSSDSPIKGEMHVKCVIFDMDGVIIDSEPLHYKVFKVFSQSLGIQIPDEEYNRYVGASDKEIFTLVRERYGLPQQAEELAAAYIRKYMEFLGSPGTEKPISGVDRLIQDLHENGVILGLASSATRETIDRVLQMFHLERYFKIRVSGLEVPEGKPAPDVFLRTAELLKVPPEYCTVIEDSHNGVKAAKAAGMTCIAYRNPNSGDQDLSRADFIIEDFRELSYEKLIRLLR